ncbi:MAG: YcjX family protein, partial [Pseudomonadota bacterium]
MKLTTFGDDARIAFENLGDFAASFVNPNVRLGVTGLSRAGKTVFITALIHNLLNQGRLPLFSPMADGRIARSYLQPQPDDDVPRFAYENHVERLVDEMAWPESTSRISQLRLTVDYESASFLTRAVGGGRLHIDIIDYPGEWLLDLPLLAKDYETWSAEALDLARLPNRAAAAKTWLEANAQTDPLEKRDEKRAQDLAEVFTEYLKACRRDENALSMLPPGRFLMPGDLAGSPAVTFAPLTKPDGPIPRKSLWSLMEHRFEAYKQIVVKPFFRDHFARLDRQVVLVDALQALNAGPAAIRDLENALSEILACFRPGRASWLSSILSRRIDKILFAATKADHLHHRDHDRLENLLSHLVKNAIAQGKFEGANVDVVALASIRATREAVFSEGGEKLHCIVGTPMAGETIDGEAFDGETEKAIYPGSLDINFKTVFKDDAGDTPDLQFVRFRPPTLETTDDGLTLSLPHIRL